MAVSRQARQLNRIAARLQRSSALPALYAFTDPQRSGDLMTLARSLPRGSALVYRAFGAPEAEQVAQRLRRLTRRQGVRLLIGANWRLAVRVKADGVHLPERLAHQAHRLSHFRLVTVAAHGLAAAERACHFGAHAVALSPVFPSASSSAGRPMGVLRLAGIARRTRTPILALGGVNPRTARRLVGTGVVGLAAVEAFAP